MVKKKVFTKIEMENGIRGGGFYERSAGKKKKKKRKTKVVSESDIQTD